MIGGFQLSESRYLPGDPIVLRRVWQNRIYRVTAMTVVQDSADLVILYLGPGYPIKSTVNPLKASLAESFELQDSTWGGGIKHLLMFISPGAAHAVYAMKNEEHKITGWYINLQEPLSRTAVGFDTTDYLLDITFPPDRSVWKWKDEADFEEAVAAGKISRLQARDIRQEGERAAIHLQEGSSSFYDAWENWLPPKEWQIPRMPLNWDDSL
jgi:hypothetical protein